MDSRTEQSVNDLKKDAVAFEADRRMHVYNKYIEDEIRLNECIDDIIDLHRDVFLLPRTEDKPDGIKNEHAYSSNKVEYNARKEDSEKERFCIMQIPEYHENDSDDFEDESHSDGDNSRNAENELAKKAFLDLVKDGEMEITRLVKSLIDKFFCFKRKLAAAEGQISYTHSDALEVIGECVMQIDELICTIHAKYADILDMLQN